MNSEKKALTDKPIAIILFLVGVMIYYMSLSVPSSSYDSFLSTATTLPRIIAAGLMLFSVVLFIQSIKRDRKSKKNISGILEQLKGDIAVYILFASALIYVFLFKKLGYISSTLLFTLAACFLLGRKTIRWYILIIFALSISIGSYLFFNYLLDVSLPSGILI
ncbi:MAG TPA: tripartite tricarboxylate transporter TctB family protein [Clostridia bacterium]|nr:tripartite tricarboxylate transporter TctB family protein [Clostridia bacterium]